MPDLKLELPQNIPASDRAESHINVGCTNDARVRGPGRPWVEEQSSA
jgi:hypothetical protein